MAQVKTTTKCLVCQRLISKNSLGLNAHMRSHEKNGEVYSVFTPDHKDNWRTVWYVRGTRMKANL